MAELNEAWSRLSGAIFERNVLDQWPALRGPLETMARAVAAAEAQPQRKSVDELELTPTDALIASLVKRHPEGCLFSFANPGNQFQLCWGPNFHAAVGLSRRTELRFAHMMASDQAINPNQPRNAS